MSLPLTPKDINIDLYTFSFRFGKCEVETAARNLIQFLKERKNGEWLGFTFQELTQFYLDKGLNPDEMLFGLMGNWYDDGGEGHWIITRSWIDHSGNCLYCSEDFIAKVGVVSNSLPTMLPENR